MHHFAGIEHLGERHEVEAGPWKRLATRQVPGRKAIAKPEAGEGVALTRSLMAVMSWPS
jgi:hypothetical protein